MSYKTVAEIYEANAKVRARLKETTENLTDEQLSFRAEENTWTINELVEHIAIVEGGMSRICARLLEKSAEENVANDGNANLSQTGQTAYGLVKDRTTRKVQAPDIVAPSGKLSIAESFAKMDENGKILQQIRTGLETVNTEKHKFPHPFFGELSATEWLALVGAHESRHIDQIEEVLGKM